MLQSMGSQRVGHDWVTEQQQNSFFVIFMNTTFLHSLCLLCYVLSLFSHIQLCNSIDWSLLGSSVHGIFQARTLEWVATLFSGGSSWPRDWTHVSYVPTLPGGFFITGTPGKPPTTYCCLVTKSCLILWDPMDCSMAGFPVLHHLLEFAQTHVHWVNDALQPSQIAV